MAKFHKVRYPILFRNTYNIPKQLKMTLRMSPIIFKNKKRLPPPPGSTRVLNKQATDPYSFTRSKETRIWLHRKDKQR